MAVETTNAIDGPFAANGVTTSFPFTFTALSAADVAIFSRDASGNDTPITSGFVVTLGERRGGSVVFDAPPASGSLFIYLDPDMTRTTDFAQGGAYLARSHNAGFDRDLLRSQALRRDVDRSIRTPIGEVGVELPVAAARAGGYLAFDAAGVPYRASGTGSDAAFRSDAAGGMGASLVGFQRSGGTLRPIQKKLEEFANILDFIPSAQHAAILAGTSTYIANADFTSALAQTRKLALPTGKIMVDVSTGLGITLTGGTHIIGEGRNRSILVAAPGGGSLAQLAAYSRGSVIGRAFNPAAANSRVQDVYLSSFGVVLNHPTGSISTTGLQIGIDLRNITRSTVERVHVGNLAPLGSPYVKADPASGYAQQGYGIVLGNVSAADPAYAGGEVNRVRSCAVWGAYKLVTLDDADLSGPSATYAFIIDGCDLQKGHHLLVQESQYNTGLVWRDNTLQSVEKQFGNASTSYAMRIEGYNGRVYPGYMELGSGCDRLLHLGNLAKNNFIDLGYYSASSGATVVDAGTNNVIRMAENTASGGAVNAEGPELIWRDNAIARPWVKFRWSGSAIVVDGKQGATVAKNVGAGDYTITWDKPFRTAHYPIAVLLGDGAGSATASTIRSQSASNVRINTYVSGSPADPASVLVQAGQ